MTHLRYYLSDVQTVKFAGHATPETYVQIVDSVSGNAARTFRIGRDAESIDALVSKAKAHMLPMNHYAN